MRRVLIWLGRLALVAVALVVVGVCVAMAVHAMQVRRLQRLANIPRSTYIVEQSPATVLDHVRVIDGTGQGPQEDQSIVIESGKVTYVGAHATRPALPAAKVIDLSGRTVFPGLVGMHEHMYTMAPLPSKKHFLVQQSTAFPLMYRRATFMPE